MERKVGTAAQGCAILRCAPHDKVADVARRLVAENVCAAGVVDGERLVGLLTWRDILDRVVAVARDPRQVHASDIMTPRPLTADAEEACHDAIARMELERCCYLPVVENGRPVGMAYLRHLLADEVREKEAEVKRLSECWEYLPPDSGFGG